MMMMMMMLLFAFAGNISRDLQLPRQAREMINRSTPGGKGRPRQNIMRLCTSSSLVTDICPLKRTSQTRLDLPPNCPDPIWFEHFFRREVQRLVSNEARIQAESIWKRRVPWPCSCHDHCLIQYRRIIHIQHEDDWATVIVIGAPDKLKRTELTCSSPFLFVHLHILVLRIINRQSFLVLFFGIICQPY